MKLLALVCLLVAPGLWAQAAQLPLAERPVESVRVEYDQLSHAYLACGDAACRDAVDTRLGLVRAELDRRDLEQLQADDALIGPLTCQLDQAAIEIHALAVRRWCHTSPWRWVRRYRQPEWCSK